MSLKTIFWSFLEWPFYTGFTVLEREIWSNLMSAKTAVYQSNPIWILEKKE